MGLETGDFISDLNTSNPTSSDFLVQGDDHLRLVKTVLQNTFPDGSKAFYFPKSQQVTGNLTLDETDAATILYVNANSGDLNITLPSGLDNTEDAGWEVVIVRTDDSANEVTIVGEVSGFTDPVLIGKSYPVHIKFAGSSFYFIGEPNLDLAPSIASASSTPIGRIPARYIEITGSATINTFGKGMAGVMKILRFSGAATIGNNANIVNLDNENANMGNGYHALVVCVGGEKWVVIYARDNNGDLI